MSLKEYIDSIKDKSIAVVGLGVSNLPLIRALAESGLNVTACDKRGRDELGNIYDELSALGVKFSLGDGYIDDLNFDIVFRTPGLHPFKLTKALGPNTVVTSEMEVFFSLCPCKTIAVTGSDGKTTTSTIISKLLEEEGYRVWLGGNIGKPLLCELPDFDKRDIAVLELSSFQLHSMNCRPDVAVITNISPNHLDVHPDYEDYIKAKKNIFMSQDEDCRLVLNLDNDISASFAAESRAKLMFFSKTREIADGCCVRDGAIYKHGEKMVECGDILIPGLHNVENYMAAFCATDGLVSTETCRKIAKTFGGVEHRIELVRKLNGVSYYNDSIASSPTRTIAGLRSFNEKVILIAGGHDKFVPFQPLCEEMLKSVKALFLTGETQEKIRDELINTDGYDEKTLPVFVIDDFRQAVLAASEFAKPGDTVILSPACSSFDKFKNFVERGRTFKDIVLSLK